MGMRNEIAAMADELVLNGLLRCTKYGKLYRDEGLLREPVWRFKLAQAVQVQPTAPTQQPQVQQVQSVQRVRDIRKMLEDIGDVDLKPICRAFLTCGWPFTDPAHLMTKTPEEVIGFLQQLRDEGFPVLYRRLSDGQQNFIRMIRHAYLRYMLDQDRRK